MFARARYIEDAALTGQGRFKGYPTSSVEGWHYCSPKALIERMDASQENMRVHQGDIAAAIKKLSAFPISGRLVLVNGAINRGLTEIPQHAGLKVESLTEYCRNNGNSLLGALDDGTGFTAASQIQAHDGVVIQVTKDYPSSQPLMIAHVNTGVYVPLRHIWVVEEGANIQLIEYFMGIPKVTYAINSTAEIFVQENAELTHTLLQEESEEAAVLHTRFVKQQKASRYQGMVFTTGARMNRVETRIILAGEKSHAALHTVQLLQGNQHSDSTTHITHAAPNATSEQHCRTIVDDTAKGAFQGKTLVARDAQKTDARQLNKNLLLSRTAEVNSKPELEIYADDVACSHGATTGELDVKALFYLMARGINEETAKRLLVEAFADAVIEETFVCEDMKDLLLEKVAQWMAR